MERSGPVLFFEPDGSSSQRNILLHGTTLLGILLHGTTPLGTFSSKHYQKWNGTATFHLTLEPNATLCS
jgi:hypothetical protein